MVEGDAEGGLTGVPAVKSCLAGTGDSRPRCWTKEDSLGIHRSLARLRIVCAGRDDKRDVMADGRGKALLPRLS